MNLTTDISGNAEKIKKISFTAIMLSFIFFFNANMHVIDLLPDIFGYIILCIALVKLADLNEDIAEAHKYFRYMILVEVGKLVALLWVFGFSNSAETDTGTLLVAFIFAVVDSILLFVAYSRLFAGLLSLGFALPNSSVISGKRPEGKSYTEKIRGFTLFFVIFKATMALLPELSNLSKSSTDEFANNSMRLYEYIGIMRGLSFFIATFVGIIWLVKIIRYFSRVNKDEAFCSSLTDRYISDILPKRGLFIRRNFSMSFFFLAAASVFMVDFRIDSVNIIPDFVGAILFLVAFVIAAKNLTIKKSRVYLGSAVYIVASLAAALAEYLFFAEYHYGAIYRNVESYRAYLVMCITSAIQTAAFVLVVVLVVYTIMNTIKSHTGFVYGRDAGTDKVRLEKYHAESSKKLWWIIISAALVVASDIFYIFFAKDFGIAGFLGNFASLIFVASMLKVTFELSDEIETKYMLD